MTVRNGEPFIHEAVATILQQTYQDFRYLILDNASTDNSRQIIRAFNDSRIDLIELSENIGQTAALNYGLSLIDTPLVARIDADDIALPHRLERQVAFMKQHPEVALLGTWCQFIDEEGQIIGFFRPPTTHQEIIDSFVNYDYNPLAHPSVIFRHRVIQEAGGYPTDYVYAQDRALWLQVSYQCKLANLPEVHAGVRQHSNQATRSSEVQLARRRDAVCSYQDILIHPSLSETAKEICYQTLARVSLDYAITLFQTGQLDRAFKLFTSAFLAYPGVFTSHILTTRVIEMIRTLAGVRGRRMVYRFRRFRLSTQKHLT
jgi:glycosyltransferase involved in cell wall biosynthesis